MDFVIIRSEFRAPDCRTLFSRIPLSGVGPAVGTFSRGRSDRSGIRSDPLSTAWARLGTRPGGVPRGIGLDDYACSDQVGGGWSDYSHVVQYDSLRSNLRRDRRLPALREAGTVGRHPDACAAGAPSARE